MALRFLALSPQKEAMEEMMSRGYEEILRRAAAVEIKAGGKSMGDAGLK